MSLHLPRTRRPLRRVASCSPPRRLPQDPSLGGNSKTAFLGCSVFSPRFPHDAGKGAWGSGVEAPRRSVREIPRFLEFVEYRYRLCFLALNIQTTDLLKSGQGPLSGSRGRRSWLLCADASLPGPSRSPPPPILLWACRAHRGREGWPPQPSLCAPKGRPREESP